MLREASEKMIFESDIQGKITPVNLAKATATAAIDPHCITRKVVQPNRKPIRGWYDSLR